MVLQKNVLFSGTIEENLRWGDENATEEEIKTASEHAQADKFVTSFKDGYNTDLGQGGSNVSGGQKQRTAIARAIVNEPEIILADEPTGALDSDTADEIMRIFETLSREGKTVIIVTHDKDIASRCKRIIEISDGVIISDRKT